MHSVRPIAVATFGALAAVAVLCPRPAAGQPVEPRLDTLFLKQATDHPSSLAFLTQAEQRQLGDPFFNLVLRDRADAQDLDAIEELLQPDASRRLAFAVHESILDPARPGSRRAVLAYRGFHRGEVLDGNVMLSVAFSDEDFPARQPFIEAWGWDAFRGRYNYYRLDGAGLPPGLLLWKFRGSSDGADLLSPRDRAGTCLQCHVNGAPVMKELAFPWNNWHSDRFPIPQLRSGTSGAWPVAAHPRLLGNRLGPAEALETQFIAPAIDQFNTRRINASLARRESDGNIEVDADGFARVVEGRRLLRPLFETTEVNLGSARQPSNLFPFPEAGQEPAEAIVLPATFLLNAHLLGGNGPVRLHGLGLAEARGFTDAEVAAGDGGPAVRPFVLVPAEYARLVADSGQRVAQRPGDAGFAWFTPEASHIDNSMVDRLLRRGVITPELVAAVAAIDLETPVFSEARAGLLDFVPESFRFRVPAPGQPPAPGRHPDDLTRQLIASLRAAEPEAGTPAAELLRRLESDDPVALLAQDVAAYRERLAARLADPATRADELRRLYDLLDERRRAMLAHEVFGHLDETGGELLFPSR